MKFICNFFLWSIFVSSCNPAYFSNGTSESKNRNLIHYYEGKSNANINSSFAPINRRIEFEYASIVKDSLADVLIMLTSGFNEGELVDYLVIHLNDGTEIKNPYTSQTTREYVDSYSYNSSVPVSRTKTITDPGGVDVVIQADGTHKHVHRPASTKTVTVNETDTQSNSAQRSQLFNSGLVELNQKSILAIKAQGIKSYEILLENCEVMISIGSRDNKDILSRL